MLKKKGYAQVGKGSRVDPGPLSWAQRRGIKPMTRPGGQDDRFKNIMGWTAGLVGAFSLGGFGVAAFSAIGTATAAATAGAVSAAIGTTGVTIAATAAVERRFGEGTPFMDSYIQGGVVGSLFSVAFNLLPELRRGGSSLYNAVNPMGGGVNFGSPSLQQGIRPAGTVRPYQWGEGNPAWFRFLFGGP